MVSSPRCGTADRAPLARLTGAQNEDRRKRHARRAFHARRGIGTAFEHEAAARAFGEGMN